MRPVTFLFTLFIGIYCCRAQTPELVVQMGHSEWIHSVAFSPDGNFILVVDGTAKLWDLSGQEIQTFKGHDKDVSSAVFSPDGNYILTGSFDHTAKLWDLYGNELKTFTGHSDYITSVAFSPDGNYILTGSFDYTAKLWDLYGNELKTFIGPSGYITSVAFSPDSKSILMGSNETLILWHFSGKESQIFVGHSSIVEDMAFSPDGTKIVSGSADGTVKLWNLSGQEIQSFTDDGEWIYSVAFSPDGEKILTGGSNNAAKLWDLSGHYLKSFPGAMSAVLAVDFSPNGDMILTAGDDSTPILWNLSGLRLKIFSGHSARVSSVDFSPDGASILISSWDHTVRLWNLFSQDLKIFNSRNSVVNTAAFSPKGDLILTGHDDGIVKLWDLSGQELHSFLGLHNITSVDFSPDGALILAGSWDGVAKLWDLSGQGLQIFSGHFQGVKDVAFHPKSDFLLTASMDHTAILWDFSGQALWTLTGHSGPVTSVAFAQDGTRILTGSSDNTAILYNILGLEIQRFTGHLDGISAVEFSPNGFLILTGSYDGTAKLWDVSGRELRTIYAHNQAINSLGFSPDGTSFLTGSWDGTTKLWNTSTGDLLASFIGFTDESHSSIIVNSNNYYMGPRSAVQLLAFKIGLIAYSFDQFDLRLNRPDKVLETLLPFGADSSLMLQYRQAYHKRLQKHGFTEEMLSDDYHAPECAINSGQIPISINEGNVELQIAAVDTLRLLDRLNVFFNDVPIYGIQGINLRDQNVQEYKTTLVIPLSRGSNKIQVSAVNQGGAESLKATTYITYDAPEQKPDLYLITIGVSDYQAAGKDLQYAAKDARDIAALYENAMSFQNVHTKVLTDTQVTKSNILALRTWLEQSQVDDQVLIYVSGHGLLDTNYDFYYATHDVDFANPAEKGILYDDIEGLLDGIPARKKLLLMDACHSGEYDKDASPLTSAQQDSLQQKGVTFKGFSKGDEEGAPVLGLQNSFEMMQQLFADLRRGSGATVISSSSGVQVSYEDAEWQNGAFTYAFLYGLKSMKADTNQDGQVTASEIQAFVAEFVPRLTEGLQVPTFRRENLEFDFRVW